MVAQAFLLFRLAFGANVDRALVTAPCDSSSEEVGALVLYTKLLQVDSFFVNHRKQWGWSSQPGVVNPVRDGRLCRQAIEALVRDGYPEAVQGVTLVKVRTGYVGRPTNRGDITVILDKNFRVLSRIVVPS